MPTEVMADRGGESSGIDSAPSGPSADVDAPGKAERVAEGGAKAAGFDGLGEMTDMVSDYMGGGRIGRVAQTTTVIAAVVIGVVAIVGIYIYDQVYTVMPTPDNESLANSTDAVTSGFGGAMEFVPVILIVLMAVVVIGAVQRLRG